MQTKSTPQQENERERRQNALLTLLSSSNFTAQGQVVKALRRAGYQVTQSSISRDFQELSVVKIGGRYMATADLAKNSPQPIFQRLIKAIDTAGSNLMVVKTAAGAANVVADEIDKMEVPGLVGTVAGDNTIMIATKTKQAQAAVLRKIRSL